MKSRRRRDGRVVEVAAGVTKKKRGTEGMKMTRGGLEGNIIIVTIIVTGIIQEIAQGIVRRIERGTGIGIEMSATASEAMTGDGVKVAKIGGAIPEIGIEALSAEDRE